MDTFEKIAEKCKLFPILGNGGRRPPFEHRRRLFSPGQNGWLKAVHYWVKNPTLPEASPDNYPIIQDLLKGLDSFYREVAELHLNCGRIVCCARNLLTIAANNQVDFAQKAEDLMFAAWNTFKSGVDLPNQLTHYAQQVGQSWVANSADAAVIAEDALRQAASVTSLKTRKQAPLTWHLQRTGWLCDLIRTLLGKPGTFRQVQAPFAMMEQGEAVLAEFVFEVIPSYDGQVFITPEQAFVKFENNFDAIFDVVPSAVHVLIGWGKKQEKPNVRISINRLYAQSKLNSQAEPSVERKLLDLDVLEEGSGTGAAGRGLYFALTGKIPDAGVIVLAKINESGDLLHVDHVHEKVQAIANCDCFDTIAIADKRNADEAKNALGKLDKAGDIAVVNIEKV